ncbi:hypothetical protein [Streptomyces smaragdinus]|nr:hypothetical protein [Streptomyces smaragdinus]
MRSPSWREALRINARNTIVECASNDGDVWLAVMPNELEHLTTALNRAV